jgi:ribonuclease PH
MFDAPKDLHDEYRQEVGDLSVRVINWDGTCAIQNCGARPFPSRWLPDHVCDTALFRVSGGSMVFSQPRSTTMSTESKQIRRDMAFDTSISRILMSVVALYAVGCTAITFVHLYGL